VERVGDAGLPAERRDDDSVTVSDPSGNLVVLRCR
jgi:hypothetical protein